MTFRTLTITTHPSTGSPVIIPDLGFDVPAAAATPVSITDPVLLDNAANSDSLRTLATDAAFPSGFGTISLDDGGRPIPPSLVSARLDALSRFEEDWIVVASGPLTSLHETTVVTAGGDAVVATGP
jgi:hypothetical protein